MHRGTWTLLHRVVCLFIGLIGSVCVGLCQQLGNPLQPGTVAARENTNPPEPENKRIFGIVPNNRTSPSLRESEPLTSRDKFKIATEDAFDRGSFALAAIFAGEAQLTNANRSFGQGAAGYGKYYGAAFADFTIADYMTEAIYPSLLHQDPRYFRKSIGSGWSRLGYAMGQIFWTHTDSGGTQFNFSEVIGNSTAVAISNTYYSDNRTAPDAISKLGTQLGVDMASNILKEFWPDIARKFRRKHDGQASSSTH